MVDPFRFTPPYDLATAAQATTIRSLEDAETFLTRYRGRPQRTTAPGYLNGHATVRILRLMTADTCPSVAPPKDRALNV